MKNENYENYEIWKLVKAKKTESTLSQMKVSEISKSQFLTDLQSLANFQFFQKTKKCNFSVDPFNSQQDNSVFKTYEVIKTRKRHIWKTDSVEKQRIRSLLTLDLKQLNSKGIHAQKKHFKAQCNQIRNWLRPHPTPSDYHISDSLKRISIRYSWDAYSFQYSVECSCYCVVEMIVLLVDWVGKGCSELGTWRLV